MAKDSNVAVTVRVPEAVRELLRVAADRDHRSMTNMLEVLILRHCEANGISVAPKRKTRKSTAKLAAGRLPNQ